MIYNYNERNGSEKNICPYAYVTVNYVNTFHNFMCSVLKKKNVKLINIPDLRM